MPGRSQPQIFLTDLEVTDAAYRTRAGLTAQHLLDVVHLLRQIIRLFEEAVRETTVDVPKGSSYRAASSSGNSSNGCCGSGSNRSWRSP
jgi:hypothetical protein